MAPALEGDTLGIDKQNMKMGTIDKEDENSSISGYHPVIVWNKKKKSWKLLKHTGI